MFIAIVLFPRDEKRPRDVAIEGAKKTAQTYRDLAAKGLIRKDYLNGDAAAGGVYLWETREAAEAWYTDDWWVRMEKQFGAKPTLQYFDHYVSVDNAADGVFIDGVRLGAEAAE